MVVKNNAFHFLHVEPDDLDQNQIELNEKSDIEFFEYDSEKLENKHTDLNLQTNLTDEHLHRNLKRIHFRANQLMEEQGYNILYTRSKRMIFHL